MIIFLATEVLRFIGRRLRLDSYSLAMPVKTEEIVFELEQNGIAPLAYPEGEIILKLHRECHLMPKKLSEISSGVSIKHVPSDTVLLCSNLIEMRINWNIFVEIRPMGPTYRGPVRLLIENRTKKCITLNRGTRICALIPHQLKQAKIALAVSSGSDEGINFHSN